AAAGRRRRAARISPSSRPGPRPRPARDRARAHVDQVAELVSQLVAIDSINPNPVPGGAGEAEIAAFAARWLEAAGLDVAVREVAPGRPNVIARAAGSGGGRDLLLNAHMDVVGVEGMTDPFIPRIEDERLYGRGGFDMKGGLAAIMLAGARAARMELRGDVIVAAVCDKEFLWLEVETAGVAAHGSRPDLGVDAIAAMGGVLVGVERLAAALAAGRH